MRFDVANPTTGALLYVAPARDRLSARAAVSRAAEVGRDFRAGGGSGVQLVADLADLLLERADELAWRSATELGVPVASGVRSVVEVAGRLTTLAESDCDALGGEVAWCEVEPGRPWWTLIPVAQGLVAGAAVAVLCRGSGAGVAAELEALAQQAGAPRGLVTGLVVEDHGRSFVDGLDGVVGLRGPVAERAVVRVDGEVERVAAEVVTELCRWAGQDRGAPTRVQVDEAEQDAFIETLELAMMEVVCGDPRDPETLLGPLSGHHAREIVHRRVFEAVRRGARLRRGGVLPEGPGAFYPLTIVESIDGDGLWERGIGGPVVAVRRG